MRDEGRSYRLIDTGFVKEQQLNEDYNPWKFAGFDERGRERERVRSIVPISSLTCYWLKVWGGPPSLKRIAGSVTKYYEVVIVKQEGSVVPEIFMRSGKATPAFRLPFQRQRIMVVLQFQLGVNPESPPLPHDWNFYRATSSFVSINSRE